MSFIEENQQEWLNTMTLGKRKSMLNSWREFYFKNMKYSRADEVEILIAEIADKIEEERKKKESENHNIAVRYIGDY